MKDQDQDKAQGTLQSDDEKAGFDRRRFLSGAGVAAAGALAGLSGGAAELMAAARRSGDPAVEWGPRVNLAGLKENFAPQAVKEFTVPPGGIDNLALHSTDVFEIPGHGQFEVDFKGYFRVARANPASFDWGVPTIRVNIVDLRLFGQHEKLGEIGVSLNPNILASGQIFPYLRPAQKADPTTEPVACRIAVGAVFNVTGIQTVLFNKEPILLMNEHITKVPPVDDPNGHALLFRLPLFNVEDPHGEPVAFLTSLRYGADNYLTKAQVSAIRERRLPA
jgi:uncharacterized protein DUF6073